MLYLLPKDAAAIPDAKSGLHTFAARQEYRPGMLKDRQSSTLHPATLRSVSLTCFRLSAFRPL
jgi:hypothetical protein